MRADSTLVSTQQRIEELLKAPAPQPQINEIGQVAEVGDGIAVVTGLARALADELLDFASGIQGIVFDLEPGRLGVVLLGESARVTLGEDVRRTHTVVSVPVGNALLGRVINSLGRIRDAGVPIVFSHTASGGNRRKRHTGAYCCITPAGYGAESR